MVNSSSSISDAPDGMVGLTVGDGFAEGAEPILVPWSTVDNTAAQFFKLDLRSVATGYFANVYLLITYDDQGNNAVPSPYTEAYFINVSTGDAGWGDGSDGSVITGEASGHNSSSPMWTAPANSGWCYVAVAQGDSQDWYVTYAVQGAANPPPVFGSVSGDLSSTSGGTLTITGSYFTSDTQVNLTYTDGFSNAWPITLISSSRLTCALPAMAAGTYARVQLVNQYGQSDEQADFNQIEWVAPSTGGGGGTGGGSVTYPDPDPDQYDTPEASEADDLTQGGNTVVYGRYEWDNTNAQDYGDATQTPGGGTHNSWTALLFEDFQNYGDTFYLSVKDYDFGSDANADVYQTYLYDTCLVLGTRRPDAPWSDGEGFVDLQNVQTSDDEGGDAKPEIIDLEITSPTYVYIGHSGFGGNRGRGRMVWAINSAPGMGYPDDGSDAPVTTPAVLGGTITADTSLLITLNYALYVDLGGTITGTTTISGTFTQASVVLSMRGRVASGTGVKTVIAADEESEQLTSFSSMFT